MAQETDQADGQSAQDARQERGLETLIVTGSASGGVSQFESSVAITSFETEDIREKAPLTISDLYAEVPGVWAETSGGESAANIFVRGIPAPGQFRFTKLQIDGLPVFEESGFPFLPPESYIKIDQTFERVEAIRGGTATIFSSNAAGGILNNITKEGGDEFEGYVGVEYGDFGRFRTDLYAEGPISDRLSYSVGGFYRIDDGVRDPGFTANDGGQIRGKLTYDIEDGEINIYGHYLNDRNIFYLPIPLALDGDGDLTGLPGFDPNFDTLTSDDVQRVQLVLPGGTRQRDLSDGINTDAFSLGGSFEKDFGDWRINNKFRYLDGSTTFNAIFSLTAPLSAQDFLDSRLADAQDAFAGTDRLVLRFLGEGAGTESTFDFGGAGSAGNNGNGLVIESGWWNVETEVENFVNDFQLLRDIDFLGTHAFTLGLYTSFANYSTLWNFNSILQEVDGSPAGLEVFAVDDDAAGGSQVVGAVTQNSFTSFGDFYRNLDSDVRVLAIYAADEWQITPKLRFDAGLRFEQLRIDGVAERLEDFDLSDTNPLLGIGDLPTLADDSVTFGSGIFDPFEETYDEFAWAVGVNYTFTDNIAVYARANDAFRTPDPNDLGANPAAAGDVPVNDIFQAEGGVKLDFPYVRAFVTGFFSSFQDQLFSDPIVDEDGNTIEAQTLLESETIGLEAELDVGPFYGFGLNFKATLQDPEIQDLQVLGDFAGSDLNTDEFIGNEVQRIANRVLIIEPRYDYDLGPAYGRIFGTIYNVGDRFANNGNTVLLPGFTTYGFGTTLNYENIEITFIGDNLTNTIGVTEGNPRAEFLAAGSDVNVATFARPIVGRNFRVQVGYRFN